MESIWYESNASWGYCGSLGDLKAHAQVQMGEYGSLDTLDDFLDKSMQNPYQEDVFGTRMEHCGPETLRERLEKEELLEDFIKMFEE